MNYVLNFPLLVLALTFVTLWISELIGASFCKRWNVKESQREDLHLIAAATLTLLGLIIGFAFSIAISGFDQRQDHEEAEASAIATEFNRSNLLPVADSTRVRALLGNYLDQRVLFYETYDDRKLRQIEATTAQLETDLLSAVQSPAIAKPTPVAALAISGMDDVLTSKRSAQAAWANHIPASAWVLMAAIAICGNLLIGYGLRSTDGRAALLLVLPLVVSIAFFLISEIDSPRVGIILVSPHNLTSLSRSLR
jgi:hypothetical protein